MIDPNTQDALEEDLKTIQYNRAVEALFPIVKRDYCFFEGVIFDYFPDIYNAEAELETMHEQFQRQAIGDEVWRKWIYECWEESIRRVEE